MFADFRRCGHQDFNATAVEVLAAHVGADAAACPSA
jgi:hypothetical protein